MKNDDYFKLFQDFLDIKGITHFSAKEVLFLGGSNERLKCNTLPPKIIWPSIIPTLRVLDKARAETGPLQLLSIYRNDAYNKAISGAKYSQHRDFTACDVLPQNITPKQLHKILLKLRNAGEFKGGLGLYSSFVHIDTRGNNADWNG